MKRHNLKLSLVVLAFAIIGLGSWYASNTGKFRTTAESEQERFIAVTGTNPVSYTHLTLPTTPYV